MVDIIISVCGAIPSIYHIDKLLLWHKNQSLMSDFEAIIRLVLLYEVDVSRFVVVVASGISRIL